MTIKTLAITIGDPAGIGPEIALKAARHYLARENGRGTRLVLIGNSLCLSETSRRLAIPAPPRLDPHTPTAWPLLGVLHTSDLPSLPALGQVSAAAGQQAYEAIKLGVDLCLQGVADALVTAPLNKEALSLAGVPYAGHTELLAELTGAKDSVMMLAHGSFRVSHVSTHIALEEATRRATPERLERVLDLTLDMLRRLGISQPRVAVAAINPHAGEGGLFGRHDLDVSAPVVQRFQARGEEVFGPVPGDTVFVNLRAGRYDAVIAMYHDQGHIPVKLLGFNVNPETGAWNSLNGVNVTLGLPIIRTSVDHGTAFDIAGQGIADESSMLEAIDYALRLSDTQALTTQQNQEVIQ